MIKKDNKLNNKKAQKIIKDYYGEDAILTEIETIKGGKTSAAYRLSCDKDKVGLLVKVAHIYQKDYLSYEKTMMESEKLISNLLLSNNIPVVPVLKYCPQKSVIKNEYKVYNFIESDIPHDKNEIDCNSFIPIINMMHNIKGQYFGFCSSEKFNTWYEFIVNFAEELFNIAIKHKFFKDSKFIDEVKKELINSKAMFDEIIIPHFVHNDLGRKNFLYKKVGERYMFYKVIDIEGALFGDIDFEYSRAQLTDEVCYAAIIFDQKHNMTVNRSKRLRIYSLLNYLISMNIMKNKYNAPDYFKSLRECYIKRFNEKETYTW